MTNAAAWPRVWAMSALTILLAGPVSTAQEVSAPAYDLAVRVDPERGALEGRIEIRDPRSATFTLSRDLRIKRVLADGSSASIREEDASPRDGAREVTVDAPKPRVLVIEYAGVVRPESYPRTTSQVNTIRSGLVELAGYVSWYPRLTPFKAFTFRLIVDAPADYTTVTNGRFVRADPPGRGRVVTEWASRGPASDMVLVSAPALRSAVRREESVEIYTSTLPAAYVDTMATDVGRALALLSTTIGAPPSDAVRLVYSPRPGWGYVRMPLIVVSEESALAALDRPFGRARDLRYVVHEIAHYWWHLADTSTPDDWINEGLAEYSALMACRTLVGPEFAAALVEEYRERSANGATATAIVDTDDTSPDREVNRYARPVLILEDVRLEHGDERMAVFLRDLHSRFLRDGRATTETLLNEAGRQFGDETAAAVRRALVRTDWRDADHAPPYRYSERDAAFLGVWEGTLTQGSASNRVVLHLVEDRGTLLATLDHPDPGAPPIPVPSARVDRGRLRFGLGAFGIVFTGALSEDATRIEGGWKQGGVEYPLTLTRRAAEPR